MSYEILFSPQAIEHLRGLKANARTKVREAVEKHLRHDPTNISKSRIKRLKDITHPQFRLRIEDLRVFYDVSSQTVEILTIIPKSEAASWLEKFGE
jgi:mRNA interferase RelE/StbE